MSPTPRSFSLTRGQADTGLGEGPGRPSLGGEQYLAAEGGLERDGPFLDAARPWMTLDAAPRDLARLGDRLEAWSALRLGNRWLVVRLGTAGTYDRRVAYFAHGRVWPTAGAPAAFDPAVLVGDPSAFATIPSAESPEPIAPRTAGLEAERPQIESLLASLYTAVQANRRLLVAAPIEEFAAVSLSAWSPLASRLALVRAALPAAQKNEVRLRIYTSDPAGFLNHGVTLLALPSELAGEGLARAPGALLVSSRGERLDGPGATDEARRYAEFAVARAFAEPAVLLGFTERVSRRSPPTADALEPAWEFASALARQDSERLTAALAALANEPPTGRELSAEDWAAIPDDALRATLLARGEGVLAEVQAEARRRGFGLDGEIAGWWRREAWRAGRLAALAALSEGIVDPNRAADRTIELANIDLGEATAAVLALERHAGRIERRLGNAAAVRMLDESAEVTRELVAAAEAGQVREPSAVLAIAERAAGLGLPATFGEHLSDAELARTLRADSVPATEVVRELDRRLERDASVVLQIFAHGDGWAWRRATRASAAVRRAAALAWLTTPPRREERLEVWNALVDDLAPGPSGDEMGRLWKGGVDDGLIPPFELDQLRRLGQKAADLTAQAVLVERVDLNQAQRLEPDLNPIEGLPRGSFLHLVENARRRLLSAPPPLTREQAAKFRRLAPGRSAEAELALADVRGTAPELWVDRLLSGLSSGHLGNPLRDELLAIHDPENRFRPAVRALESQWLHWSEDDRRALQSRGLNALRIAERTAPSGRRWLQKSPALVELLGWLEPHRPIADLAFELSGSLDATGWAAIVELAARPAGPPDVRMRWPEAEIAYLSARSREMEHPEPLERALDACVWKGSSTMNDIVTWFGTDTESTERAGAFDATWDGRPVEAMVWPPSVKAPPTLEAVAKELEKQGAGTLIFHLKNSDQWQVRRISASAASSAQRLLAIAPTGEISWCSFESGNLAVSPGQRFLVPINAESEQLLQRLVASLEGLPHQRRALMLQSLVTPSIGLRVERLERALKLESTTGSSAKSRQGLLRWLDRVPRWLMPVAAAVGVLALGIAVGEWLGKSRESANPELADQLASVRTQMERQERSAKELDRRTKEILDRLEELRPKAASP